jgi:spermidine synthase
MALSAGRDPAILDTVAAAYAEAGRFGEAVETARKAAALAAEANQPALAATLQTRVALYEAKTPLRGTRLPVPSPGR